MKPLHSPFTAEPLPAYLNKRQAAQQLGVTERTIDNWISRRLLPFLKIGRSVRFDSADVRQHLLANCRVGV
jgi:excisionase family DNA binding protein